LRASSQRRRLALLALIAASGSGGISRDKVLSYLWPSTDNEHARHSLAQLIYSMRHALGCKVISGESEFQLDSESLTSDIGEFMEASGNHLRMTELHAGPFLDGFHLNDSIEFTHWADRVRERTTAMACVALESLAHAASDRGDHSLAVATWRARAAMDPLDAGPAMALMEALAAAGDRAGSIRNAHAYQKLIRDELDMEADPRVTALASRFRRETPSGTRAVRLEPVPVADLLDPKPASPTLHEDDSGLKAFSGEVRGRKKNPRLFTVVAAVAAVAVGVLGIAGALWSRGRSGDRGD
jgi:DNA-binding transcriptional activator of the SARP family